jgi:hypothetical protein
VSGEPVYGAEYLVEAQGKGGSGAVLSLSFQQPDHEGRFKITRVPADLVSVVFGAKRLSETGYEGYAAMAGPEIFGRVSELDLSEPNELDVGDVLLITHRLRGQIVDGRSGRLMTGSELSSLRIEASGGTDTWERNFYGHDMEFSEDGFFTVTGVRPDWERLEIGLPGFTPVQITPMPPPDVLGVISLGVIRMERG